jgi:hypothetical protein
MGNGKAGTSNIYLWPFVHMLEYATGSRRTGGGRASDMDHQSRKRSTNLKRE